jgi:hypothetical protein
MHRTQGDSFGIVSGKRVYREESPGNWDATQAQAVDGNAWQEEIAAIIEDGGVSLNPATESIAQMKQASGVIQGYVTAEAFARNAADRVTNGDLARNQINTINDTDFDEPLLATVLRIMGRTLTGFWCAITPGPTDRVVVNRGTATAVGDAQIINLKTTIRKDLESVWAVGDNQGGRASTVALVDDTWYHLFVIKKNAPGPVVDAGFDTALNAVNLLADSGYSYYRRVGSFYYVDSTSKVRQFVHDLNSDYFLHNPAALDGNYSVSVTPTITSVALLKGVPLGLAVAVDIVCAASYGSSTWDLTLWDGAQGGTSRLYYGHRMHGAAAATDRESFRLITDTSQRIYAEEGIGTGAPNLNVQVRGYVDSRFIA